MGIKSYLTESYTELKKVNWPTRQETTKLTLIVIGFSLGVAIFLGILDIIFSNALSQFFF
ncbi:preprotein translocase subunit SecE [Candidatus Wolfebacteria bacterium RIFCSPHIGHO2_01_FULL_48_22]|uniref:Protein translocase subunit SecE n=2 Tax=Candidatus Wolfeibacteriota TaxID=1752735 RepID=A0A1F8DTF0_9BACT|nr:MAG: preprotein translocase subunit SecE [Candidatus Wolfebacteria bacterium RIFCSPHIGHO2_01_FULL_48_22]OGM92231.1 MAG: preprotein translocase subunit SecE [Candidatus Wolfebacteria bacterium RIFCSPLOWO2_01_FULL_47_17b]